MTTTSVFFMGSPGGRGGTPRPREIQQGSRQKRRTRAGPGRRAPPSAPGEHRLQAIEAAFDDGVRSAEAESDPGPQARRARAVLARVDVEEHAGNGDDLVLERLAEEGHAVV